MSSVVRRAQLLNMRSSDKVTSQPTDWGQRLLPHHSLSKAITQRGNDSVMYAVMDLNQRNEHKGTNRKAPFVPVHERTTVQNEVSFTAHTHSSHGYYPDCGKTRVPCANKSQKTSLNQGFTVEQPKEMKMEYPGQHVEVHRAYAIANKALEIEKLFRQDCETFGLVVKMLIAKKPTLEGQLHAALKENLIEIKKLCLEDLRHFISEVNIALKSDHTY